MKLVLLGLLLPLVSCIEPEFDNNPAASVAPTNSTDEETGSGEINNFIEALENDHVVQWDIDTPDFSVKKSAMPKRGKVLQKIVLTKQMKKAIIMAHNRARSITKPPASNMRKMTWDNSLEKLATSYTRKCIYEHNPEAKNNRFEYVGENLFISMGLPYNAKLLDHAVKAWDAEKTDYDYNTMKCKPGKVCGHYTQVVWAESFKIGCGVTRCGNINVRGRNWKNAVLFGCNYGPGGNYRGEKPYKRGKKCTKCHQTDKCSGKLCANTIRDRLIFNPKLAKWTPWSEWSACSVSCGMGSKRRSRFCKTFVPSDCKGFASEVKFCMNKPCKANPQSFQYQIVLNEGDNFDPKSILELFKQKGNTFRRTSG